MIANIEDISELLLEPMITNRRIKTFIIYGTAVNNSADGKVNIQIDDDIYNLEDEDNDYLEVNLLTDDNDIDNIDDDETENEELFYWDEDDDYTTEQDPTEDEEITGNFTVISNTLTGLTYEYGGIYIQNEDSTYSFVEGTNLSSDYGAKEISYWSDTDVLSRYGVSAFYYKENGG